MKNLTKIDLYSMGYSVEKIAEIKGLTVKEVRDWIKRNGIERSVRTPEKKIKQLINWC